MWQEFSCTAEIRRIAPFALGLSSMKNTEVKITLKMPFESCSYMDSGRGDIRSVILLVHIEMTLRLSYIRSWVSWRRVVVEEIYSSMIVIMTKSYLV